MVVAKPHADRVISHPSSWSLFERLLEDLGDLPRLHIYACLVGIPEVWCYDEGRLDYLPASRGRVSAGGAKFSISPPAYSKTPRTD